jgi:hypothetical protein
LSDRYIGKFIYKNWQQLTILSFHRFQLQTNLIRLKFLEIKNINFFINVAERNIMYWLIGTPNSIQDLKTKSLAFSTNIRSKIPIAIIDDEVFAHEELLKEHGYNIRHFLDIEDVKTLEAFPIILCDIKGVGKKLKSQFEGGHLIEEIRKYYPHKIIYAYSAYQQDPSYNRYYQMADRTLKKDYGLEEWISNLDDALKMVIDPSFLWIRIRNRLLDEEVSICETMKLEDQFVSYMNKTKATFPDKRYSTNLSDHIKSILMPFVETVKFIKNLKSLL